VSALFFFATTNTSAQKKFDTCAAEGTAKPASYKALNVKKNRWIAPTVDQINDTVTFEDMMAADAADDLSEGDGAEITGYVIGIKLGALETCNCKKKDTVHRDTHIELLLNPADSGDKTKILVVEVTPRFQRMMKKQGLDWTTRGLKEAFLGKWVKVRGWLFFDAMHADESAGSGNTHVWRGTAWELHPVSHIELTAATPQNKHPLRQCSAITTKGTRCERMTSNVSGRCWQHEH